MSRIDMIGLNGGDGELYHYNHKHGHGSNKKGLSPTYISWRAMKDRCLNKKSNKYSSYGGAGIKVQDAWVGSFIEFLKDMGDRPDGTTLDRFPNQTGDYCVGNCRWATPEEQANNTKSNVAITYKGVTWNIEQWVRLSGIPRTTFYRRYYNQGKTGNELFKPTINMKKSSIYFNIVEWIAMYGNVNFTQIAKDLGEDRHTISRIYKEFS